MTQANMPNLPGFDAMADTLEFVKNMWSGMQTPPGIAMPALSLEEINKQITDLKAVESWLSVNMTMLRGTIQALEVQSATLATLNAMGATFAAEMKPDAAAASTQNTSSSAAFADAFAQNATLGADPNFLHAHAGADAASAWWSALQTQFNQAVSSVMADEVAAQGKNAAPTTSSATAAKKTAATSEHSTGKNKSAAKAKAKTSVKAAVKKRPSAAKS